MWIDHVPFEQAGPELRAAYEAIYKEYPADYAASVPSLVRPDGGTDSITAAHSLVPEAMRHMMTGLAALLKPELPLARRQHEMIAAVVSVRNQCFY